MKLKSNKITIFVLFLSLPAVEVWQRNSTMMHAKKKYNGKQKAVRVLQFGMTR